MMPTLTTCETCGQQYAAAGLAGNCPACLARAMLEEDSPGGNPVLQRLGDYDLLGEEGRGGMGVVYRARQRSLDREVAVKVLAGGEFAHASLRGHLQREARAVARLQHPNLVPVYEVAEEDGVTWLAMEFIPGRSLAEAVRKGPLRPSHAAGLIRKVAEAVAHAHAQGVIHRDLKPSNILLDGRGEPRVADFGLASLTEAAGVSLTGQAVGTPAYAAPEQVKPAAEASVRTGPDRPEGPAASVDVYSLGATLYHLLTGRPPFVGDSAAAVLLQVVEADPLPPARVNPSVPRDLDTICRKAMEKDPSNRYSGARELAEDLGRFLEGRGILARPSPPIEVLWRWCRRRPAVAGLALTSALALICGSLGILIQWRRAEATALAERQQRDQAHRNERAARLQGYVADMFAAGKAFQSEDSGLARSLVDQVRPAPDGTDFRGVEWRLLQQMTESQATHVLEGHDWIVSSLAVSPDGRWLVSGGRAVVGQEKEQATALVWDTTQRQLAHRLEAGLGTVRSVAFSHDGNEVLIVAAGKARLFRSGTWQETGFVRPASAGSLARRHPWLAILTEDQIVLLNYVTGEELRRWPGGGMQAVAFSPDDGWLAAGSRGRQVELIRLASGEARRLAVPLEAAALGFSPDGRWLAAACGAEVRLWDLMDPDKPAVSLSGHRMDIWGLGFTPDGRLVSAGSDRTIRFWKESGSWQAAGILRGHRDEVWSVASDPAGQWLASGSKDTTVRFWPPEPPPEAPEPSHETSLPPAWSADGRTVLLRPAEEAKSVLWDPATGRALAEWPGVYNASMPDGGWVRLAARPPQMDEARLDFCDGRGQPLRSVPLEGHPVLTNRSYGRAFSANRQRVASVLEGAEVGVWNLADGKLVGRFKRAPGGIAQPVAISADGRLLAMAGSTVAAVDLVEIDTGRQQRLTGHQGRVTALGFSPDGRQVASGSVDASIRLWNTLTGAEEGVLRGHIQDVDALEYAPDGRTLGSVGRFEALRLWNVETGRQVLEISLPDGAHRITFSPDGHWISVNQTEPDDRTNSRIRFLRATPPGR